MRRLKRTALKRKSDFLYNKKGKRPFREEGEDRSIGQVMED